MRLLILISAFGLSSCLSAASLDGEQVYKSNCNRCHITIHTYSEKMSRSIVRHMRVMAMLTKPEADAVLAYLSDSVDPASKAKSRRATP
jgi:mono/diheme cytochrome c family protein